MILFGAQGLKKWRIHGQSIPIFENMVKLV